MKSENKVCVSPGPNVQEKDCYILASLRVIEWMMEERFLKGLRGSLAPNGRELLNRIYTSGWRPETNRLAHTVIVLLEGRDGIAWSYRSRSMTLSLVKAYLRITFRGEA